MQAAMAFGIAADERAIFQQLPLVCQSGNCRWDDYISLGICSTCINITDQLTKRIVLGSPLSEFWPGDNDGGDFTNVTSYFLPNGHYIDNLDLSISPSPILMAARTTAWPSRTVAFGDSTTLVFAMSIIRAHFSGSLKQSWTSVPITAAECALQFCLKRYTTKIENGTISEESTILSTMRDRASWKPRLGDTAADDQPPPTAHPGDPLYDVDVMIGWCNRTDLQMSVPQNLRHDGNLSSASISQGAVDSLIDYASFLFNSTTYFAGPISGVVRSKRKPGDPIIANGFRPPSMQSIWNSDPYERVFDRLAASMSNNIRATAEDQGYITGQQGVLVTKFHVRWPWIILPIACILFGSLSLLITSWETRRSFVPVWKNSVLAILFHGLDDRTLGSFQGEKKTVSEIERAAAQMLVQLDRHLELSMANDLPLSRLSK